MPEVWACRSDSGGTNLQGYRTTYELFVRGMRIYLDCSSQNGTQAAKAEARLARVI